MSASNRKRQAGHSGQVMNAKRRAQELVATRSPEDHHQIRGQRCCNCASPTPHTLLSCTECGHTICTRCPVDDPLLLFPHPGLIQQRYEDMNKGDEHGNLEMGQSMFQRDQEHELGHDAEEEEHQQELQLQSQSQPTGKQRQVETGVSSKRNLNMNKCERCRLDKKKCLPVDRTWPAKCDLCIKKGFSCSESKRIVRSTKHAPAATPSPMNTISPSPTSASFEERLKQWTFLLSYRKMMMAAKNRLEELEKRSISLFPFTSRVTKNPVSSSYVDFSEFVNYSLDTVLFKHATELFTLEPTSPNLPGWFLTTHLNQAGLEEDIDFTCSKCFPAHPRSRAVEMENPRDSCSELLLLQHRFICHDDVDDDGEHWEALVRSSHEVQSEASGMFESHGFSRNAKWAKSIGVYHPDIILSLLPGTTENVSDCLERSWLHMRMDNVECWDDVDSIGSNVEVSIVKDEQDILGRTALIIACQEAWPGIVRWLLEEEADPGITTIHGSIPLHYAAVKGSFNICEQLLAHKTRFDLQANDCAGKTALDYAREKKYQDVVDLLSAEYAAADQAFEELKRARNLQTGLENHEVQGSYFV